MALDSTKNKRINLLNIVERLVEKTEEKNDATLRKKQEEVLLPSPRSGVSIRPYLLPPTPSSGPASPSISEESIGAEDQANDKGAAMDNGNEEIKKDVGVPKQPQRCDVCGLRVYKSYRFVTRTSAPAHLKNFVTPENDRIRVCKRCFSSRERCRENLALVLLRSKTSQMVHLRTPLGVTYNRATKGIEYIARDLKKSFKRPYEDLLCDETMADEDEMEVDDDSFLLNGDATKNQDVMPKLFAAEHKNAKQGSVLPSPVPVKNIGFVTVVRHQSGKFSSTPNCFTIYGEVGNLKLSENATTDKIGEQSKNGPAINAAENLRKLVDQNRTLPPANIATSSDINTINNKLTFLDHAYALPPPKGKVLPIARTQAVAKVKSPASKVMTTTNTTKQGLQKKTASPDGQKTSERTCGIVCFLCDNLVTKSYSCYKKENAPEKIKHLFTPGVKIVKVCRRCMPYKKPKEEEGAPGVAKGKVKVVKGKLAKIKSAKLIKNAKSTGKGNAAKASAKKVTGVEKKRVKSPIKNDKKQKNSSKEDNLKVSAAKKQHSVVVQTKKIPTLKGALTKDVKMSTTRYVQVTLGSIASPKEDTKSDIEKLNGPKGVSMNTKILLGGVQRNDSNLSVAKKEISVTNKLKSAKVDSGTQSMKSMIGINRVKTKSADSEVSNEATVNENKPASLKLNEKAKTESSTKEGNANDVVTDRTESITSNDKVSATENEPLLDSIKSSEKPNTEKVVVEEKSKEDMVDNNPEDSEVILLKESEDSNTESENLEVSKGKKEDKITTDSKNLTENVNTRERRSASKSPVRAKEVKPAEVPSPRRGRSAGTPDKKREDYKQIMPTVMTRKRLASFSESEVDKKGDNETVAGVPGKRRAVVALLEKMSRKSGDALPSQSAAASKAKEESATSAESPEEEGKGHSMTRRNQMPIKCPGCNEKVVKSYRCIMRGAAPVHIKPLFQQQMGDMLRICRKCVKNKGKS